MNKRHSTSALMDFLIAAALTVVACPLPLVGPLRVYLLNKLNKALEPRHSVPNPPRARARVEIPSSRTDRKMDTPLVRRQKSFDPSSTRQVGRVTPCAPFGAPVPVCGAHGVTRPTMLRN